MDQRESTPVTALPPPADGLRPPFAAPGTTPTFHHLGGMRPALNAPVACPARHSLWRRLRNGTVLTTLMLGCYFAMICSLTVFFSGVFLTTEHVVSGAAFAKAPPRYAHEQAWQHSAPSQQQFDVDFARYRQNNSIRAAW